MINYKSIGALIVAVICTTSAHAYKAIIENKTSGDITFSINLAACRPIQAGVIKAGQTSQIFETGACCFESVNATGISGAITNISSGNVRPWNENTWQCFYNLRFTVHEKYTAGKVTGLIVDEKSF